MQKAELKKLIGRRIELIKMKGEDSLVRGDRGVVSFIDDICQIHVDWDNGSTLAIIPSEDSYKVLSPTDIKREQEGDIQGYK